MSEKRVSRWALVLAALVIPVTAHAQAGTDTSSNPAAQKSGGVGPAVETGHIDTAAVDTGRAGMKADTTHNKKAKKPQADTAATKPYSPY